MTRDLKRDATRHYAGRGLTLSDPHWRGCAIDARRFEQKNNGPRELVAMANTAAVDLEGEVVEPKGLDPSPFERMRSIYANHEYFNPEGPVATLRSVKLTDGGWLVRMAFASTAFAQNWATLVEEEAVNGVSIGFERIETGPPTDEEIKLYGPSAEMVTRKASWFELSVTPMPCNPEAMIQRGKAWDDKALGRLDDLVRKGRVDRGFAEKCGLPTRKVRRVVVA